MKKGMSMLMVAMILSGAIISLAGTQNADAAGTANGPWPMFRGNPQHTGLSPYDTSNNDGGFLWNYTVGGQMNTDLSIGPDGTIYVHPRGGDLFALNPDGSLKWTYNDEGSYSFSDSTPAIGPDGTIYVAFSDSLIALNPDGTEKWTGPGGIEASPTVGSDGTIYTGISGNSLCAINPDGTVKWQFTPEQGSLDRMVSSPAIGPDGTIYIGSTDTNIYAVNPDGTEKWRFGTEGAIWTSPAVGGDGTVYIGSYDNDLYAIDSSGHMKWKFETGDSISTTPAIGPDGTIYLGGDDGYLYAINPDGTEKWSFTPLDQRSRWTFSSPTISADGTIYVGCNNYFFFALSPDGALKWKYKGNTMFSSAAIGADSTIYVADWKGTVYAFGGSGHAIWPSSPPRNVQVTEENGKVVLTWELPEDTGRSQITEYIVYRSVYPVGQGYPMEHVSGDTLRYEDTFHLESGMTYYYYVTAVNGAGESYPSERVSITITGSGTGGSAPQNSGGGMTCMEIYGIVAIIAIAAVLLFFKRKSGGQAQQVQYQNPQQEGWNSTGYSQQQYQNAAPATVWNGSTGTPPMEGEMQESIPAEPDEEMSENTDVEDATEGNEE